MSEQLPLHPPQRPPVTLDEYIAALIAIRQELASAGVEDSPQVQAWSVILKRHHATMPRLAHEYKGPVHRGETGARFWHPSDGEKLKGPLVVRIL